MVLKFGPTKIGRMGVTVAMLIFGASFMTTPTTTTRVEGALAGKLYPRGHQLLPPSPPLVFSSNDVYPTKTTPRPTFTNTHPLLSVSLARNMSQTTDLREFVMKFVQDERICTSPSLRQLIMGEGEADIQTQLWWNRRCGGRRGNPFNPNTAPALSESTLLRYRRKSSNRARRKNTQDLSQKDQNKLAKLLRDKRVVCKPKKTVVRLPNTEPDSVMLRPHCVYIKQCSGCCDHSLLECTPTRNKTRRFPVMAVRTDGRTSQFADSSPVRRVRVTEHTRCQCECKVKPAHCSPRQVYNAEACQCTCPVDITRTCPRGKVWNESSCECVCSSVTECTTGRQFDHSSCRCLRT
ncbi:hypothetical protein Pmani_005621 [Petrolisthes manimaculis]|uniref:Platelet-derived growth factor (PDGF) family profile domain-containing protein n=1 Tax=Petrolisthes manimaculis TaxID=1843537 RepID=A0AAE1UHB1_9EUCA|nr:hypothetical protein Pmani_005621 [Petrolisthes manimaculis]